VGKLVGIAMRAKPRQPMELRATIEVVGGAGLAGDVRGKTPRRNVTVLSQEGWDAACGQLGEDLPWTSRRANLLVEGIDLREQTGRRLRIGAVVLEITGPCEPCARMNEVVPGLRRALAADWRAGVSCTVVTPGRLNLGDPVTLDPPAARP
jgi:MOSC domain-containing protein YiiM